MNNLTIFAKKAHFRSFDRRLFRGSSIIRGEQIATYLKLKLNPNTGWEKDICIFVKPNDAVLNSGMLKIPKKTYLDLVDASSLIDFCQKNPQFGVIACSEKNYQTLKKILTNEIVLIPQQHCNFERLIRNRRKITTVGIIGVPGGLALLPADFEEKLSKIGLNLLKYSSFRTRQDVVSFYQKIDIQAVWRPGLKRLSNPLKIVNAASFGIPTIAFEEDALAEVDGCYFPIKSTDEFISQAIRLKSSPRLYRASRERCLAKAEKYHLSKIAKKYQKLGERRPKPDD